jgi:hypothetical protein
LLPYSQDKWVGNGDMEGLAHGRNHSNRLS